MPRFQLWAANQSETFHLGSEVGESFEQAVLTFAANHPSFRNYFDRETFTYYGCRLFDNEAAARESFG